MPRDVRRFRAEARGDAGKPTAAVALEDDVELARGRAPDADAPVPGAGSTARVAERAARHALAVAAVRREHGARGRVPDARRAVPRPRDEAAVGAEACPKRSHRKIIEARLVLRLQPERRTRQPHLPPRHIEPAAPLSMIATSVTIGTFRAAFSTK